LGLIVLGGYHRWDIASWTAAAQLKKQQ
jgi:hypothetical protein